MGNTASLETAKFQVNSCSCTSTLLCQNRVLICQKSNKVILQRRLGNSSQIIIHSLPPRHISIEKVKEETDDEEEEQFSEKETLHLKPRKIIESEDPHAMIAVNNSSSNIGAESDDGMLAVAVDSNIINIYSLSEVSNYPCLLIVKPPATNWRISELEFSPSSILAAKKNCYDLLVARAKHIFIFELLFPSKTATTNRTSSGDDVDDYDSDSDNNNNNSDKCSFLLNPNSHVLNRNRACTAASASASSNSQEIHIPSITLNCSDTPFVVKYSSRGDRIACAFMSGGLSIFCSQTGAEIFSFDTASIDAVSSICWSNNDSFLCCGFPAGEEARRNFGTLYKHDLEIFDASQNNSFNSLKKLVIKTYGREGISSSAASSCFTCCSSTSDGISSRMRSVSTAIFQFCGSCHEDDEDRYLFFSAKHFGVLSLLDLHTMEEISPLASNSNNNENFGAILDICISKNFNTNLMNKRVKEEKEKKSEKRRLSQQHHHDHQRTFADIDNDNNDYYEPLFSSCSSSPNSNNDNDNDNSNDNFISRNLMLIQHQDVHGANEFHTSIFRLPSWTWISRKRVFMILHLSSTSANNSKSSKLPEALEIYRILFYTALYLPRYPDDEFFWGSCDDKKKRRWFMEKPLFVFPVFS